MPIELRLLFIMIFDEMKSARLEQGSVPGTKW
jgi:hypothetical protein